MVLFWCLAIATGMLYLLVTIGSFRLVARHFAAQPGEEPTSLFDIDDRPMARAGFSLPRVAAAMVPGLLGWVLVVALTLAHGLEVATNRVDVPPGPARTAGMETGDRVLSIDGHAVLTFDDIKSSIAAPGTQHRMTIERADAHHVFEVAEDAHGRVDLRAMLEPQAVSLSRAMLEASGVYFGPLRGAFGAAIGERHELMGPVAIVRSVDGSSRGSLLRWFEVSLAYVGSFGSICIVGFFLVEVWSRIHYRSRLDVWLANSRTSCELYWLRLRSAFLGLGGLWIALTILRGLPFTAFETSEAIQVLARAVEIDWAVVMFLTAARVLQTRWRWLWGLLGALGGVNLVVGVWLYVSARRRALTRVPAP